MQVYLFSIVNKQGTTDMQVYGKNFWEAYNALLITHHLEIVSMSYDARLNTACPLGWILNYNIKTF